MNDMTGGGRPKLKQQMNEELNDVAFKIKWPRLKRPDGNAKLLT